MSTNKKSINEQLTEKVTSNADLESRLQEVKHAKETFNTILDNYEAGEKLSPQDLEVIAYELKSLTDGEILDALVDKLEILADEPTYNSYINEKNQLREYRANIIIELTDKLCKEDVESLFNYSKHSSYQFPLDEEFEELMENCQASINVISTLDLVILARIIDSDVYSWKDIYDCFSTSEVFNIEDLNLSENNTESIRTEFKLYELNKASQEALSKPGVDEKEINSSYKNFVNDVLDDYNEHQLEKMFN